MDLKLTDKEANDLIFLSKEILEQYNIKLEENCEGEINITSPKVPIKFILNYFIKPGKVILNFRETQYNTCLLRINIFSVEEYKKKNDSSTYMVAYPLPYKVFEDSSDFVKQLFAVLRYTNTNHNDKIYIETKFQLGW
ncbi:hypothetical protein N9R04_03925 [Staphylococcus sp. SQ8-PEA]|uniref:Uncharacterized protein n=1 Tax=Staphylococcus marylandisciuri TaxID=2981529 RepID=A0ABT2QPG4_9STAP|nr:hypothetical protein [Staphylococcus marylandisciuri]MCU5745870.1 hypothetical protein [Staphylococcus marylandisciuri]